MKPRFIFVHGNQATHWSFAWSPWLKSKLEKLGFETFFETMPDSVLARSEYWLPFLKEHVRAGANDVIVGWSSGAVAAMRYVENNQILGSILISPCYTDLNDEMEKLSGYYDAPWQWAKIVANQNKIALIWGDNDPYIPQAEFEFIVKQINSTRLRIRQGGHFIDRHKFPELLSYIKDNYL